MSVSINIRGVDTAVHSSIKLAALLDGKTLQDFIIEAAAERAAAALKRANVPAPSAKKA